MRSQSVVEGERETADAVWASVTVSDEWASAGEKSLVVKLSGCGCKNKYRPIEVSRFLFSQLLGGAKVVLEWRWLACYQVDQSQLLWSTSPRRVVTFLERCRSGYSVSYGVVLTQKYKSGLRRVAKMSFSPAPSGGSHSVCMMGDVIPLVCSWSASLSWTCPENL